MANFVVPNAQALLDLTAKISAASYVGAKLALYNNDLAPTPTNVLADFTPCAYTGYAPIAVTYSAPFFDVNGIAVVSCGEKLFIQTGSTGDLCYGVYLTDSAGAVLLGSARLDTAPFPFVNSGNTLPILLKVDADGGLVVVSPVP